MKRMNSEGYSKTKLLKRRYDATGFHGYFHKFPLFCILKRLCMTDKAVKYLCGFRLDVRGKSVKEIMIKEYIGSDIAISYDDGVKCQKDITECLDSGKEVILNFFGVNYVIAAFLNPVIGDLILNRGAGVMECVRIKNANETVIQKIKYVRDSMLINREDLEACDMCRLDF